MSQNRLTLSFPPEVGRLYSTRPQAADLAAVDAPDLFRQKTLIFMGTVCHYSRLHNSAE